MDMEVEPSSPLKRFGIKNSIQTNFGDDYVFQIDSNHDNSTLAVSLSTNSIKLYSPVTGQYIGECTGHSAPINQISFSAPSNPNLLNSCSSDGTIRAWDIRSFNQVSLWNAGSLQEVFSFSFGGSSDNLLAAGCKTEVLIWDWRKGKRIACLEESHVEDVTQVHFSPDYRNKLISASVDGLICKFDTEGNINDDDHLESVMNVGTSIAKIGFCGNMNSKLWCMTHIETLSIWDWKEGINEANIEDARTLASDSWTLDHVDYFVDCHYSGEDDRLYVIGGTNAGSLGYFPINYGQGSRPSIGSPGAILEGGHVGVVRTVLPMSSSYGGRASNQGGIFGWTGGEDGRLCCWLSDDTCEVNRSWISNGLVIKPVKSIKKSRHQPY
ncbi:Protein gts1 [Ranunculus cassubicifolius]